MNMMMMMRQSLKIRMMMWPKSISQDLLNEDDDHHINNHYGEYDYHFEGMIAIANGHFERVPITKNEEAHLMMMMIMLTLMTMILNDDY